MGPVVNKAQQTSCLEGLRKLKEECTVIFGGDENFQPIDADREKSAFVQPTLLACNDGVEAKYVHDVEVFGPAATLVAYDNEANLIAIARRGLGSLVASIFSNDAAFLQNVILGIGDMHGRVVAVDSSVGGQHTGHGNVVPSCLHGGPGRAGGGEELAGLRALLPLPPPLRSPRPAQLTSRSSDHRDRREFAVFVGAGVHHPPALAVGVSSRRARAIRRASDDLRSKSNPRPTAASKNPQHPVFFLNLFNRQNNMIPRRQQNQKPNPCPTLRKTIPHHKSPTGTNRRHQRIPNLVRKKRQFIFPVFVFFFVYFFTLPILIGYAPKLMSTPILGPVTAAYAFALSQFPAGWLIAALYLRASKKWDRQAKEIRAQSLTSKEGSNCKRPS